MARKTTKKIDEKKCGKCYDCEHAYLMQSSALNPIVSQCKLNKERQVAQVYICTNGNFKKLSTDKREVHKMIKFEL